MNLTFNARSWHAWLSIVLLLPMFIVAITTFFMAHEKTLGLQDIQFGTAQHPELKYVLYTSDGAGLLATKHGVYSLIENRLEPLPSLQGMEVRRLEALAGNRILAAGKQGLWIGVPGGDWQQLHAGDIHALHVIPNGPWHIVVKDEGLMISNDQGRSWRPDENVLRVLNQLPAQRGDLGKLMHDLHTGKALFGKSAEWIWIDIVGAALVFLCMTGVWVWWKTQQRKG